MSAVPYQTSNTFWYFVLMDTKDLLVVVTGPRSDVTQSEEEKANVGRVPLATANPSHSTISPKKFAPETYSNKPPFMVKRNKTIKNMQYCFTKSLSVKF